MRLDELAREAGARRASSRRSRSRSAATGRRSSGRSRTSSRTRGATGAAAITVEVTEPATARRCSPSPTRAAGSARTSASTPSSASGAGRRRAGLGPRARDRAGDGRAPRRPRLRRRRSVHDRAARLSETSQSSAATTDGTSKRKDRRELPAQTLDPQPRPRRRRRRSALAGGGAAIAVAAGGGGPTPPPKPLDQAIHDALAAPRPDGVTARVTFTNNLFPSGALLGQVGSALMSGASGRLWLTNDGRGRIELQSDAGDVQIVWNPTTITVYDASSNTVYRADLPAARPTRPAPTTAAVRRSPRSTTCSPSSASTGRSPTRSRPTSRASPPTASAPRRSTTAACSARSSSPGTPRRACRCASAIYAQGSSSPVLELAVTDISYGAVAVERRRRRAARRARRSSTSAPAPPRATARARRR